MRTSPRPHPAVLYPAGSILDGEALAVKLNSVVAHPEFEDSIVAAMALTNDATVATAVPGGSGTVYDADTAAAAIGALVHWVVGDKDKSNVVVVPIIAVPSRKPPEMRRRR